MVDGLSGAPGAAVLDVAAGTGSISRLLQARGWVVTAVDLSQEMLGRHPGPTRVLARAERLPFADAGFDVLTFGYLLRYVDDPVDCLVELGRVMKPGGQIGMVEFGLPQGIWNPWWRFYSGTLLPQAGRLVGPGWREVGSFLRGSIEDFYLAYPEPERLFERAGFTEVRIEKLSLGGGVVAWGRKP